MRGPGGRGHQRRRADSEMRAQRGDARRPAAKTALDTGIEKKHRRQGPHVAAAQQAPARTRARNRLSRAARGALSGGGMWLTEAALCAAGPRKLDRDRRRLPEPSRP